MVIILCEVRAVYGTGLDMHGQVLIHVLCVTTATFFYPSRY